MTGTAGGTVGGRQIWIVNHYADGPDRPNGTRHFDLARQLVARGDSVTIFASGFSHVTRREERLSRGKLYSIGWFEGVRFVWLRTFPYAGNTWRRQANMLSFVASFLVVQAHFAHPDSIIGSTVHPFAALAARFVAKARGSTFLFEIRDLWPQTLVDLGAMRQGSAGERLLRGIEAHLVRSASVVISLLPGTEEYLRERGLPSNHVVYLPNGVDLAAFDAIMADDEPGADSARATLSAINRLRAEGRFVIGYVGSLGRVNGASLVVDAARRAEEQRPGAIGLVVVGDGPERAALIRQAVAGGPVVVAEPIPKRAVATVLRAFDGAVVHATATPVYRYGISFNKLFEYMAASRPVIFACATGQDPVQRVGAGLTVPPDDAAALAMAFLDLADSDPADRARMGERGRALVEREHSISVLATTLSGVLGR